MEARSADACSRLLCIWTANFITRYNIRIAGTWSTNVIVDNEKVALEHFSSGRPPTVRFVFFGFREYLGKEKAHTRRWDRARRAVRMKYFARIARLQFLEIDRLRRKSDAIRREWNFGWREETKEQNQYSCWWCTRQRVYSWSYLMSTPDSSMPSTHAYQRTIAVCLQKGQQFALTL